MLLLFSICLCFFFSRSLRLQAKNLVGSADEFTTKLGDASSDRVDVSTLIGIAQLFDHIREANVPTHLLFFGLPRSVASAEIFQEVRVYRLVHLRQLHGARIGKQVLATNVANSCMKRPQRAGNALRTSEC